MSQNFILELKLDYNKNEKVYLDKVFWHAKNIYNYELNRIENRYKELIKTKRYRGVMSLLGEVQNKIETVDMSLEYLKKNKNSLNKIIDYNTVRQNQKEKYRTLLKAEKYLHKVRCTMIRNLGISEYDIQKDMKRYSGRYITYLSSTVLQKVATTLSKSVGKTIYKYRPKFRYKSIKKFTSIEGKDNKNGISFDLEHLLLKVGLKKNKSKRYKVISVSNKLTNYEKEALKSRVCYCRIVRRDNIRGKSKYYLQLVLKGSIPIKTKNNDYSIKGNIGIDTGLTTMAICSESRSYFVKLAKKSQKLNNKVIEIQSYIDRSKRLTNTNKYNTEGTYKKTKEKWNYSKRCKRAIIKLRDLQRKQKYYRKEEHNLLANEILKLGDVIYVEPINYKGLAKRGHTDNDTTNKRFGKSITNCAPALLLSILKNKAKDLSKTYKEINTKTCKASQYNHIEDKYQKVGLDVRVKEIGKHKVQRDLYSAFLIMNVNEDLRTINKDYCDKTFERFIENQDKEIQRIKINREDYSTNFGLEEFM